MKKIEKITRDAKILTESAKDMTRENILSAIKSKALKIDESQIVLLMKIIEVSINDGYARATKSFQRSVEASLLSE